MSWLHKGNYRETIYIDIYREREKERERENIYNFLSFESPIYYSRFKHINEWPKF